MIQSAKDNNLGIWSESEQSSEGCTSDIYNCGDFSSCLQVMEVFNACSSDVNKLDRDDDGVPCESLCR